MSITYKSGGVNRQYSGSAVVIKDAAETLHFFEASSEKSIGISGEDTVSADAGTETYTVVGAGSLGVSFAWGVNSPFSISGGVLTIPANSDGATANITLSFDGTTVASKAVTVTAAAPATYDINVPTVTGATITVLVNDAPYTSGKLTHGDSVSITVAAQPNYNITSSSVTMGGQPVTGSNGEYSISSVTGAVEISVTVEAEPSPTGEYTSVSSTVESKIFTATFAAALPTTDIEEIEIRYAYDSTTNPINSRFVLLQKINGAWKAWYKKFNNAIVDNIAAGQVDITQSTIAVHPATTNSYAFSSSVTDRTMYARTKKRDVNDVKAGWV